MHCKLDIEKSIIKTAIKAGTTKNIKAFSDKSKNLFLRTDRALYDAKDNGRNRIEFSKE